MIIIDNSVLSFAFQLENGIPILPFYDNFDDNELKFLMNYLCNISSVNDLREQNKISIKMDYFLQAAKEEVEDYNTNKSDKDNLIKLNMCSNMNYSSIDSENELNSSEIDANVYLSNKKNESMKKHSIFKEQLINTLDDLKKTFEKKKCTNKL